MAAVTAADVSHSPAEFIVNGKRLFGRTKILLDYDVIDESNVLEALGSAEFIHGKNSAEIEYLWRYYRGDQQQDRCQCRE